MTEARLPPALARPELVRLWATTRLRLERNGRSITAGRLPLDDLSDGEIAAICGLLARRRPPGNRMTVSLAELDVALRRGGSGQGLLETLEALGGPVRDRRAERSSIRQARSTVWTAAAAHPAAGLAPVDEWIGSLRRRGRLTRLDVDDPVILLTRALDGVHWLLDNRPQLIRSPIPLPALAAARFGDSHALDPDVPLGVLLADAVVVLADRTDARAAWASFGVQLDRVSTSALTLMLPGAAGSIAGAAAASGEPLRITHRMLDRGFGLGLALDAIDRVWVCENPAIVSLAADHLGDRCRPLVCTEGMPSAVTAAVLDALRSAGVQLRVHADFDLGGVAITGHLLRPPGAVAWRMGAADYLAALDGPTSELAHGIGATPWDLQLAREMNRHRRAVHEEALHPLLLADLTRV